MAAKTAPAAQLPARPPSLAEVKKARKPPVNVYRAHRAQLGFMDKLALWITAHVGTMGFFLIIFVWTVIWLGWNFLAPKSLRFDPPMGFVLWLFISNCIQILLMPLIMVGQNVQGGQADARAQHDLEVNVKAEKEIEVILGHLEYQNAMLLQMMQKLDIKADQVVAATTRSRR
ncbi:MAG: DUF1003 domain-containing protein [Caulobacteraceae bacterium]